METIRDLYAEALKCQKAGDLRRAERCYREILEREPRHANALHFLGVVAHQVGRHEEAIQCIANAIALNPSRASYHCNLGLAYRALNRVDEAASCFRESIRLRPDNPVAHNNLGVILLEQGRAEDAAQAFQQAKRFNSKDPEAYINLGKSLRAQGKLDQAIAIFEEAIRIQPASAESHHQLGVTLREQGRFEEAVGEFLQALRLQPDFPSALNHLGATYTKLGRAKEAEAHLRKAVELDPTSASSHSNLGVALLEQERLDEAEASIQQALRLSPDFAGARSNLGAVYLQRGEIEPALTKLEEALRVQPDIVDAHWNRSLAWLTLGRFREGWLEYEWRWLRSETRRQRHLPRPLWDGSPLDGRTILLHAEQGLGDTLQFIRYAKPVAERGGRVLVACQTPLVALLARCPGVDAIAPKEPGGLQFDLHAPLMSLPGILGTEIDTIPREVPYIIPDPKRVERWRQRLAQFQGLKVGIAWQGNRKYRGDRHRSIPLRSFAPVARLPGVHLISLQKGDGSEQIPAMASEFPVHTFSDLDNGEGAFMDTAAMMASLDLVITSDTAIPHLAGAVGCAVWVALSSTCDWRWLRQRDDSPWYPTMRLFRQRELDNWDEVFQRIATALGSVARTATRNSALGT